MVNILICGSYSTELEFRAPLWTRAMFYKNTYFLGLSKKCKKIMPPELLLQAKSFIVHYKEAATDGVQLICTSSLPTLGGHNSCILSLGKYMNSDTIPKHDSLELPLSLLSD